MLARISMGALVFFFFKVRWGVLSFLYRRSACVDQVSIVVAVWTLGWVLGLLEARRGESIDRYNVRIYS
jgi:hypothetical protein